MFIYQAIPDDYERLRAFDHRYRHDGSPRYYERQWQTHLDCPASAIYLAQNDTEIAGFIHISDVVEEILIEYLYVAPQYRGQKIAQRLMETALNVSDDKQYPTTLFMWQHNSDAFRLYKKFGFAATGIPGFDGMVSMMRAPVKAPEPA